MQDTPSYRITKHNDYCQVSIHIIFNVFLWSDKEWQRFASDSHFSISIQAK